MIVETQPETKSGNRFHSVFDPPKPDQLLTSRNYRLMNTVVDISGTKVGDIEVTVMAGPCAVESIEQILHAAHEVKRSGATVLRGGAFKPKTSPYDFQGLGKIGLEYLRNAADSTELKVITEVLDPRDVELVSEYADCLQIGTRNMQNYPLLRECGQAKRPVLLKRGLSATYKEFLMAAEYIMAEGNEQVILCERGIRGISDELRFTLDLNAVPYLKEKSHLPVIVDPNHGTGYASLVRPMSRAAIACGADGILVETHSSPKDSVVDAKQTISTDELSKLISELSAVAAAIGRRMIFPDSNS